MARISMRNVQKSSVSQYFDRYLSAAARGVKDKTLHTYSQHFQSIARRLAVTVPMNRLNAADLDKMILTMREEGLSASSINSYTRTLKVFFSWCNEEGHTKRNIKLYKAPETVKEVYTDEELLILLKKPEANCNIGIGSLSISCWAADYFNIVYSSLMAMCSSFCDLKVIFSGVCSSLSRWRLMALLMAAMLFITPLLWSSPGRQGMRCAALFQIADDIKGGLGVVLV